MATLFRIQTRGIAFEAMRGHRSTHEGPECEEQTVEGLACCDSVDALRNYISGIYFGDMSGFEVVVFAGRIVERIYDGVVSEPQGEISRLSVDQFLADDSVYEYEA